MEPWRLETSKAVPFSYKIRAEVGSGYRAAYPMPRDTGSQQQRPREVLIFDRPNPGADESSRGGGEGLTSTGVVPGDDPAVEVDANSRLANNRNERERGGHRGS
jgi:hypothetical protein